MSAQNVWFCHWHWSLALGAPNRWSIGIHHARRQSQPRQIALNITASLAFNIPWPLPTNVIGNYAKNQREQNVTDEFYYSAESTWHCNQNHSGLHQMSALFLLALSIVGDLTTVKMNLSLCEIKSLVIL